MRNFIVKHFALYHVSRIFGKDFRPLRASTHIASALIGLALFSELNWMIPTIITGAYFIFSLFIGFVYFDMKPIKWHELDDDQKWQYGNMVVLSPSLERQWRNICDDIASELTLNFRKAFPAILPLLLAILTILVYTKVI